MFSSRPGNQNNPLTVATNIYPVRLSFCISPGPLTSLGLKTKFGGVAYSRFIGPTPYSPRTDDVLFSRVDGVFTIVLGVGFVLCGILMFLRGRRGNDTAPEPDSKEFIPPRWSPKTLRFGGVGMFLVGVLMLVGELLHLF